MRQTEGRVAGGVSSPRAQYAVGVAVLLPVVIANFIWMGAFQGTSVLPYSAAVVLASRFGGLRGGLAAAVLSLGLIAYLNMPPLGFAVRADDRVRLIQFAFLSALIAYLSERVRRHLRQIAEKEEVLLLFSDVVKDYGICSLDPQGRLTSWSPGLERLSGYGTREILGKSFAMFFPAQDIERGEPERILARAAELGTYRDEGWRLRKGGSRAWFNAVISAGKESDGRLKGYTVVAQDMTRQRLEQERFRLALESAPSGMVLADGEGRIVLVNKQVERLFGYARDEIVGKPVEVLVPERFGAHKAYREAYQRAPSARRMGESRDLYARRKDGGEFPVEIGLTPIESEEGRFVLAAVVDVTERKKAQDQLRKAHEDLERRVLDLEEFSYTVSHDLRAPLRAIEGFSQMILQRTAGRLEPEERTLLDRMAASVRRMDRLIEDVLTLVRASRRPLELGAVDLNVLVEDVLARYPLPGVEVRVLGPLARVHGNEGLLTQILANLLSNAAKFAAEDRKPKLEIGTEPRGERVLLTVKDNGIGIPDAFREKIFKPFERVPSPLAREGTGIGLAIVKKAAERMDGRVGVDSEPGAWSRFWVDLPGGKA